MNYNWIVREICSRERGKKRVPVAQVREIMSLFSDIMVEHLKENETGTAYICEPADVLLKNGERRARARK
jgi:hypothetical protein